MQLLRLLLLLLAACIALSDTIAAAEDQTSEVVSKTREKLTATHQDGGKTSNFGDEEDEEREFSFLSKIKGVFGVKKAGLANVASLRKNPGVVKALEKNPTVKRLGDTIVKDPNFLTRLESNPKLVKQLSNNPELQRAASTLDKAGVKITTNDINKVKAAVAHDPAKVSKMENLLKVLKVMVGGGLVTLFVGVPLALIVSALIAIIRP